jgi:PAS domain S-box-containing protein
VKKPNNVFNELPIPSYIWQQVKDDFILIEHNKAAEFLTKGHIKKFLGKTFSKMYEKSPYLQEIQSNFVQCIKEKKSISHEMRYLLQSTKETKDFVVSYVFVQPDLIMVQTEDITKRKLAEKELRILSNAVEQTADSVLITDTSGVIEYVNPAFEKTSGFRFKDVVGQTPRTFNSGKHDSRFYKNLWDTIKKGETFRARIINKKRNNVLYWADQTITPMKDNDGNITNYVSVLKDITENVEKQKQELQLKISEEKNKKFEELDQMKSRFFANISHEFRSPLTLILGPSESIVTESNEEETRKKAGTIKRNANRLLGLINQLLDLSKLEAGKMKLEITKGNIVSFLKGITMSFESVAEEKDITLKAKASNDEIEMYFDKEKMIKIITNLLSNAIKFTQQGEMITVRIAEIENNFVEIKIRDTGMGLSEEELPHIFDRFYQADHSNTREHEGTGIGLALTKELVELHHGTISVDSKLGDPGLIGTRGTEFTIKLPLGKEHLSDDEIVEDKIILNEVKNQTEIAIVDSSSQLFQNDSEVIEDKNIILVVEDNAEVRDYIKDSLGKDYQIEEASNGEQGVRKAEQFIPDLIISDIMMPKMDGNELIRILKNDEKTSHIPIILLTAKSEQESRLEGLETGADDYLTKPFNTKELQVRINNLISMRRKLQKKYSKRDYVPVKRGKKKKLNNLDEKFISKVIEVIENHISEEEFNIEQFGKDVGMGRVQLHRKLKALTGKSASQYIKSVKLSRAKKMIEEGEGNISEIAFTVGFRTSSYFTRCFKKEYGYPPSDLLK